MLFSEQVKQLHVKNKLGHSQIAGSLVMIRDKTGTIDPKAFLSTYAGKIAAGLEEDFTLPTTIYGLDWISGDRSRRDANTSPDISDLIHKKNERKLLQCQFDKTVTSGGATVSVIVSNITLGLHLLVEVRLPK